MSCISPGNGAVGDCLPNNAQVDLLGLPRELVNRPLLGHHELFFARSWTSCHSGLSVRIRG